jgi:general nucleoside transport system permease protein
MIGSVIDVMTPLLLAALGGLLTELSGALAICLEGLIAAGAFAAAAVALGTGSLPLALLAGLGTGTVLAFLYAAFVEKAKANLFICALAVNLFATGVTGILAQKLFGSRVLPRLPEACVPPKFDLPLLGGLLGPHDALAYLAWLLPPLLWLLLWKTGFGLRLRAAGSSPETLRLRGGDAGLYRVAAASIAGGLCGLAGAWLSLGAGAWTSGMQAGKGWIALVAVYLGFRRPAGVFLACAGFAAAQYLSDIAQATQAIPNTVLLALPYALTLVAYVAYSAAKRE